LTSGVGMVPSTRVARRDNAAGEGGGRRHPVLDESP
jgi:hypothetical protein